MSYCSNCGARIKDNGVCPNCGSVIEDKLPGAKKSMSELLVCLKSYFSTHPLLAVENAARTSSSAVWVTFGVIFVVASVIFNSILFFDQKFNGLVDFVFGEKLSQAAVMASGEISGEMLSAMACLIFYFLVMSIGLFLLIALSVKITFTLAKSKPTFSQALNVSGAALLPMACCLILSAVFSQFSVLLSLVTLLVGYAAFSVSLYFGVQKAAEFEKSPFWLFIAELFGCGVILELLSMVFTKLLF